MSARLEFWLRDRGDGQLLLFVARHIPGRRDLDELLADGEPTGLHTDTLEVADAEILALMISARFGEPATPVYDPADPASR